MVAEASPRDGRERAAVRGAGPDPAAEAALIVVLSPSTIAHVDRIARAGWDGPVLAVGSVEEARALLDSTPARPPADHPPPEPQRPRLSAAPTRPEPLRGLVVDPDRRKVVHAGQERTLTPLEFGVLEVLAQRPGQVRRFAELTRLVWGTTFTGDSAHLHAVVRRLRRKLEGVRAPVELAAVRGVGFRLTTTGLVEDPRAHRPEDGAGRRVGAITSRVPL